MMRRRRRRKETSRVVLGVVGHPLGQARRMGRKVGVTKMMKVMRKRTRVLAMKQRRTKRRRRRRKTKRQMQNKKRRKGRV